ncbi:MAG: MarR family winged helix-turn-helix transcriptional regulator [Micromonosporaceae bacterium]
MTHSDIPEREAVIDRISQIQQQLGRAWAQDRSLPLLASTLTMQQLKIVIILDHRESVSGQELAHALGVGLGTVTGIVDRLVARDLVSRREDQADRRIRRVSLAPAGRALADEMLHAGLASFRRVLDTLDTATLRTFESIMAKLRDAAVRLADEPGSA